jgi:hypothetical protein
MAQMRIIGEVTMAIVVIAIIEIAITLAASVLSVGFMGFVFPVLG